MSIIAGGSAKWIKTAAITLVLLPAAVPLLGQHTPAQRDYESAPVELRGFEERDWEKAVAGLDYSKAVTPTKKRSLPDLGSWGINPELAKVLIILTGAIALAIILYNFFGKNRVPSNKRVDALNSAVFNPDKLEDDLLEAPFEKYIQQALQQGQYALAIRLHYLWALQSLARGQFIHWKKDKTNREFLVELRTTPLGASFSQATAVYEWVWYGNQPVSQQHYEEYAGLFAPLTYELAASRSKAAAQ